MTRDLEHRVKLALLELDNLKRDLKALQQTKEVGTLIAQVERTKTAVKGIRCS